MVDGNTSKQFLEPVYLNEKMVLNCAAYLFGGTALESETKNTVETGGNASIKAAIQFLQSLFSAEAGVKRTATEENRATRRYTVGGLHMVVLDELYAQDMIFRASTGHILSLTQTKKSYVEIPAMLRPIDYFMLIGTLKAAVPLVAQVLRDFGDRLLPALRLPQPTTTSHTANLPAQQRAKNQGQNTARDKNKKTQQESQPLGDSIDRYETSLLSLLDKLEADYLTSKQLEMVMWSEGAPTIPMGIVELDTTDYEPAEIRAKLAGGSYYVLGKIVGTTNTGDSLSLMQKATIWSIIDIFSKVIAASENQHAVATYFSGLKTAQTWIEKVLPLSIKGPAVRIAAMSICI